MGGRGLRSLPRGAGRGVSARRAGGNTDPETLRYDYGRFDSDGPSDWWSDACELLLRFLRQTGEKDLSGLALDLERLRERATVQRVLAERDIEGRYVAPRKAAKVRPGG